MTTTPEWRTILAHELTAEAGSFLLTLRVEQTWDDAAFERLADAMAACCAATSADDLLERWVADGFYYLATFPRGHTNHAYWADHPRREAIDDSLGRLDDLAHWYFTGEQIGIGPRS